MKGIRSVICFGPLIAIFLYGCGSSDTVNAAAKTSSNPQVAAATQATPVVAPTYVDPPKPPPPGANPNWQASIGPYGEDQQVVVDRLPMETRAQAIAPATTTAPPTLPHDNALAPVKPNRQGKSWSAISNGGASRSSGGAMGKGNGHLAAVSTQ